MAARHAWRRVEALWRQYEREDAAWKRAQQALAVVRPDGRVNDRGWASEQIASALPVLSGRAWSKVRGLLQTEAALMFLDRLHRPWQEAVPDEGLRAALVRWWWRRRHRPRAGPPGAVRGAGHVAHLVQQVVCQKLAGNWRAGAAAGSRVRRGTVRASRAVECMNSVLRMHQSRHRTHNQGLLDLKRLYWNCQAFREGKRRRRSPYELLGLKLPSSRFWDLLQMPLPTAEAA